MDGPTLSYVDTKVSEHFTYKSKFSGNFPLIHIQSIDFIDIFTNWPKLCMVNAYEGMYGN